MTDAVRLAIGTLTRWPVTPPAAVETPTGRAAMLIAPWVGLLLGGVAAGIAWGAGVLGLSSLVAATVVTASLGYASRGLHLDGLADLADGLGSGREATGALAVMRRGDIGPTGVAAVVFTVLLQVAAVAAVLPRWGPLAVAAVVALSRLALPVACLRGVPAARPDGLGAAVAGSVPPGALLLDVLATGLVASALLGAAGAPPAAGAVVTAFGLTAAAGTVAVARRRLGGVTGDVLGAAVELALAAALIALALF